MTLEDEDALSVHRAAWLRCVNVYHFWREIFGARRQFGGVFLSFFVLFCFGFLNYFFILRKAK